MFADIAKIVVIFCKESDMILCSRRDVYYVYVCVCACVKRRGEERRETQDRNKKRRAEEEDVY